MKWKLAGMAVSIFLVSIACNLSSSTSNTDLIPATNTPAPPVIIEVTPTHSVHAAEEANAGAHHYWMSPNEQGCEATDETSFARFRDKELEFAPDFSTVTYGGRTYPRVEEHRYQSINQDDKPLVLVFSEHGYILYVYEPGKDPNVDEWCLTFSFTLAD